MSLWLQMVREKKFKSIEHRFLVSGHTFLPSDRDFALIEKAKKYHQNIYDPNGWIECIEAAKSNNPYNVTKMNREDFKSFNSLNESLNINKKLTEENQPIKFKDIRIFRFESDHPDTMFIKRDLTSSFETVNLRKRGRQIDNYENIISKLPLKYDGPVKINSKKINDIRKLFPYITLAYQQYFQDNILSQVEDNVDDKIILKYWTTKVKKYSNNYHHLRHFI